MKKFLMTLLILGAVIGVVAMMRRRSGSDMDEWRSFADDAVAQAKDTATEIADTATDAVEDATS